jgi:hypothetical protein
MADLASKIEIGVTTGPIRGSHKVHIGPRKVAMREIHLEPSSGEPPVRVYDTSGPYTDPKALIDISVGLPELRRDWIRARGDVEEKDQREVRPEDNGLRAPPLRLPKRTTKDACNPSAMSASACCVPSPARMLAKCTMPAKASSRPKWNMWRSARIWAANV